MAVVHKKDRVILNPFTEKYINVNYLKWLNDNEVTKYSRHRSKLHSFETCRQYYNENKNNAFYAIEYYNDKEYVHVGNILGTIDFKSKHADISIMIGEKSYWGLGVGYTSFKLLIDILFSRDIYIITSGTISCNTGMVKLMDKLKMNPAVTIPKRFLLQEKRYDLVQGYLLNKNL